MSSVPLTCPRCGRGFEASHEAIRDAADANTTVPCPNLDCGAPATVPPAPEGRRAVAGRARPLACDTVLVAALNCAAAGGEHIFRSRHAVACWALDPAHFSLAGYSEYPDSKKLDSAISRMVKQGLFAYIAGKPNHWELTPLGLLRAQALRPEPKKAPKKGKK